MNNPIEIVSCRSCGSKELTPILSLGDQYVTNFIEDEKKQGEKVPLDLVLCEKCKLLQLKHNAPPESMWSDQYWYKSGISTTIKNDLRDIVEKACMLVKLEEEDLIIDIGCNDGTLLEGYNNHQKERLIGFEPSKNVAKDARGKGFNVINNFFNFENFYEKFGNRKAKIITAISMFYDLEDPNTFLEDITKCLDKDGLFIIQQNYLLSMLEQNAFDNICHEHREYYSLLSFKPLLERHGLEIFDISTNDINGGSIRTYIKFKGSNIMGFPSADERIKRIEEKESLEELTTNKPYIQFANRIESIKKELLDYLTSLKKENKKIWIYGASTRGNVILQYFGLNNSFIEFIADKNSDKWGKKTVGSLIPIVPQTEIILKKPDYLLVNVWHFFKEIKEQEKEWFNQGGIFLVPLPTFKVISN